MRKNIKFKKRMINIVFKVSLKIENKGFFNIEISSNVPNDFQKFLEHLRYFNIHIKVLNLTLKHKNQRYWRENDDRITN